MKELFGYIAYIGSWVLGVLILPLSILICLVWAAIGQSQALGALVGGFLGVLIATGVVTYVGWNA